MIPKALIRDQTHVKYKHRKISPLVFFPNFAGAISPANHIRAVTSGPLGLGDAIVSKWRPFCFEEPATELNMNSLTKSLSLLKSGSVEKKQKPKLVTPGVR